MTADGPRAGRAEHGVSPAATPWAEPSSRFTALLEAVVIDWLKEASFAAVARRLGFSWDEVDGIMARAVVRGLARRYASCPARIGLDKTSFQNACATIPLSPQPKSKSSAFSPSGCGISIRPLWTFMRSCPRASGTLNQRQKHARARPMLGETNRRGRRDGRPAHRRHPASGPP